MAHQLVLVERALTRIDSRTGLGSFDDYFRKLVEWLKTMSIAEVLAQPEVQERIARIRNESAQFTYRSFELDPGAPFR